jgi:alpha-galactosidase
MRSLSGAWRRCLSSPAAQSAQPEVTGRATTYARLDSAHTTFAVAADGAGAPRLLHFGARLRDQADLAAIDMALRAGPRESTPDAAVASSLYPPGGYGWLGEPALAGVHDDGDGALFWSSAVVERSGQALRIELIDLRTRLRAQLVFALDAATGVLASRAQIYNDGATLFRLQHAASICLPLPSWAREMLAFNGDWAREGQPARIKTDIGAWSQTNRTGRTGFAGSTMAVLEPGAGDQTGQAIVIHLAWSGDHRLSVEMLSSGERMAMAGALLSPGEVALAPGDVHETPAAYACWSGEGFNGVSDRFHPFVRRNVLPESAAAIRKVHFNSWEAAYFRFDETLLKDLASAAADIGVERFVLDDGWFEGRRDDASSLGDWRVDRRLFADGLNPLIKHVHELGMDFGLWVEPEMVSPHSELYRQHPDWCVHAPGGERPTMRNQLWLDMARSDVRDHLFAQLDALLSEHAIAYLKWDCNRFLFPAVSHGAPGAGAVLRGTYALLDHLRSAHPNLEIESCASGGARIDLEILKRATRVWPSDSTDAIERLRIQRWASLILPLDVLGAHIGPSPNPITGRVLAMEFRARVALLGHLGLEMDPRRLSKTERASLMAHIALYKTHRGLIHSGRHLRWTTDDGAEARMCISERGEEALVLACRTGVAPRAEAAPVRLPGLDPGSRYRLKLPEPWPTIAQRRLHDADGWRAGLELGGDALGEVGIRLPLTDPETAWLIHLQRL